MTTDSTPGVRATLAEGRDYYIERGAWVFTRDYLLSRGKCCSSGCRHCPYRSPKADGQLVKKEVSR